MVIKQYNLLYAERGWKGLYFNASSKRPICREIVYPFLLREVALTYCRRVWKIVSVVYDVMGCVSVSLPCSVSDHFGGCSNHKVESQHP